MKEKNADVIVRGYAMRVIVQVSKTFPKGKINEAARLTLFQIDSQ